MTNMMMMVVIEMMMMMMMMKINVLSGAIIKKKGKLKKAQKGSIKKELLPAVWHPSRWWDWCVPEDEKKETEKLWA